MFNKFLSQDKDFVTFLENILGFVPSYLPVYHRAFKHKSASQNPEDNNERLELLGDAYLTSVVVEHLYKKYPYRDEGFLTQMKSKIVSRKHLNALGDELKLLDYLEYQHKSTNNIQKDFTGNTLEALIGAIYLAEGFKATQEFIVTKLIADMVDLKDIEENDDDYKSQLYIYAQRHKHSLNFPILEQSTQSNRSFFKIGASIDGDVIGEGGGFSKKAAEQHAARDAMMSLGLINDDN